MFISLRRRYQLIKRYRQIVRILTKHGFDYLLHQLGLAALISLPRRVTGRPPREILKRSTPERLRLVMEELGPTSIKLGQILSTRADLLPGDYIAQMERLQDNVPPVPFAEIRQAVEKDLGRNLETLFAAFDPIPLAAASIAQVHRAVLDGGTVVVVKVQRPGVRDLIDLDLHILQEFGRLADRHLPWGRIYSFTEMVEEFRESMTGETDFRTEARQAETIHRNLEDDPRVHIPRVYWTHTTQRVLTMEYVTGIKLNEPTALATADLDRTRLARVLAEVMLKQILVDGVFHADPHPGNILVLPGERLIFIDFGITGRLNPALREDLARLMVGLMRKNADMVIKALMHTGVLPDAVDIQRLRCDVEHLQQKYYDIPLHQVEVAESLRDFLALAYRHHIRLPTELTILIKTLITVDGVVRQLAPEINIAEIARPLGRRLAAKHFSFARLGRFWTEQAPEYAHTALQLPSQLLEVLEKLSRGELRLRQDNPGLEHLSRRITTLTNRLILTAFVIVLFMGAALFAWLDFRVFGILSAADLSLMAGTVLGIWLLVKTLRPHQM